MPSTATKDWTSRAWPRKGELFWNGALDTKLFVLTLLRFGWVNASYIYGLQIVNAHMRRALGTLTPYDTFIKAVEDNRNKALAELE